MLSNWGFVVCVFGQAGAEGNHPNNSWQWVLIANGYDALSGLTSPSRTELHTLRAGLVSFFSFVGGRGARDAKRAAVTRGAAVTERRLSQVLLKGAMAHRRMRSLSVVCKRPKVKVQACLTWFGESSASRPQGAREVAGLGDVPFPRERGARLSLRHRRDFCQDGVVICTPEASSDGH